jgi:hypothetical protein
VADWTVELRDRVGGFLADVTTPFKVRRGRNESAHVSFTVDHEDEVAYKLHDELTRGIPQVACYRDEVLWARGWWAPMDETAGQDTGVGMQRDAPTNGMACTFRGPFAELENRSLRQFYAVRDMLAAKWDPITADQADHVMSLAGMLTADEATWDTGLFRGTVTASVTRDRLYEIRKNRAEAILQLTEVIDGVELIERPVEQNVNSAGKAMLARLDAGGSGSFGAAKGLIFEGSDCESVKRTISRPVNWVYALGGEYDDGGPQRRSATAIDQASIDKYRLHELTLDLPGVYYQATLTEHVNGELRPDPPQAITFTPDASGSLQPQPDPARQTSATYWLGDTVRLVVDRDALQIDMTSRIRAIEVAVDADGNESHALEIGDQRPRPLVDMLRGVNRTQRGLARQIDPGK